MPEIKTPTARELFEEATSYQYDTNELSLGPWTSYSLINDPKHMAFVLSRYKFVAKMLEGKSSALEVGGGDGFGLPIMAQAVKKIHFADWDMRLIEGNQRRLKHLSNVEYHFVDLNKQTLNLEVEAAYLIDVIEHVEEASEDAFLRRIVECLPANGVLIMGTPNKTASQYASPRSALQHINLKTHKSLKQLSDRYCHNTFMFGMNDEVLHTGYGDMCHYIWSIGVGIKR
jgi:2-polyprenyl-3-methyl-5-hydroxy-6-metoxy-1,4-benzoquinol methylase